MPSTLNPACLLCGLRYGDRPLRELHIRGDPGHGDAGDARTAQPCVSPHLTRATGFRRVHRSERRIPGGTGLHREMHTALMTPYGLRSQGPSGRAGSAAGEVN